ncbi:hypothetical protein D1610_14160 [Sphingomonas gilva]|uniref:Uncharacterized protein n=1 Tax=Sphingomonas gilva TaxID=2305907 RepID=A0A396RNS5_9SPHN|nr:hypothetical protein D1610_14160 [Sphingomonas gilva]
MGAGDDAEQEDRRGHLAACDLMRAKQVSTELHRLEEGRFLQRRRQLRVAVDDPLELPALAFREFRIPCREHALHLMRLREQGSEGVLRVVAVRAEMRLQLGRQGCVDDGFAIGRKVAGLLPVDETQEEAARLAAHVEQIARILEDDDLIGIGAGDLLDAPSGVRAPGLEPFLEDRAGERGKVGARSGEIIAHPVPVGEVVVDQHQHEAALRCSPWRRQS